MPILYQRFLHLENRIHHQLVLHSITWLRLALGVVFFGFGFLKYFPGVSPAQHLTESATHILFLGLIPGFIAIKFIATLECVIGLLLLSGRGMRLAVWLLAFEFVGILSPIVLLPGQMYTGPHHAPSLAGQYCIKDIILVTSALVVAAASFRGGRLVRSDLPPDLHMNHAPVDAARRLRLVLDGIADERNVPALCARHDVTESEFYEWRGKMLTASTLALTEPEQTDVPAPSYA
jgi:putative oxidoreductase